jgi:hypothetical protein
VFAHQRESIPLTCIYSGWRVLDFAGLRFVIPAKAGIHFDVRASNRIPDHLRCRVSGMAADGCLQAAFNLPLITIPLRRMHFCATPNSRPAASKSRHPRRQV